MILIFIIYTYFSIKKDNKRNEECERVINMATWEGFK